jgi:CRISPR-associated endoribonuclease Cas6
MHLCSITISFTPLSDVAVPPFTSKASRTILAKLLESNSNTIFLSLLESKKECKPYTVTPIFLQSNRPIFKLKGPEKTQIIILRARNTYMFRAIFNIENMILDLAQGISRLGQEGRNLELYNAELHLGNHSVKVTTFKKICKCLGYIFRIDFLTPTMFAVSVGMQRLFPTPNLVLGSILKHWNTYASNTLRMNWDKTMNKIERGIFEVDYDLRPVTVPYGRSKEGRPQSIRGFLGWCIYQVKDPSLIQVCERLLAYGEYVGVGKSRSMGMGMITARPAIQDSHTQEQSPGAV